MHEKRVTRACHRCHRFTYGLLEHAGLPRLSMFIVWCLLGGVTALAGLARGLAGK